MHNADVHVFFFTFRDGVWTGIVRGRIRTRLANSRQVCEERKQDPIANSVRFDLTIATDLGSCFTKKYP